MEIREAAGDEGVSVDRDLEWMLLIYTVPSQPSRKRAAVWRELKRLGAVYLRDGVALLPRQPALEAGMREMVQRIEEYEGTAELVLSPQFAGDRQALLVERFQEERTAEYREIYHACVRFLRDVLHEVDADDFGFPDVDNLESELGRLRRWHDQIRDRDYFRAPGSGRVTEILDKCERAFEQFVSRASERTGPVLEPVPDDVFERLGGPGQDDATPEDVPI